MSWETSGRYVIFWSFSFQAHKMWVTMPRGAMKIQCNKVGEVPVRTGNRFLVHRLRSLSYL